MKIQWWVDSGSAPIAAYIHLLSVVLQFALVETILTSYMDLFPQHRKKKWLVLLVICGIMYLLGLVLCTNVSIIGIFNSDQLFGQPFRVNTLQVCLCCVYKIVACESKVSNPAILDLYS